jgi:hypothetical protein
MKKELQPMHLVGSLLKEQFEQEESHAPVINAQVAIPQEPLPVKEMLAERVVTLMSAI